MCFAGGGGIAAAPAACPLPSPDDGSTDSGRISGRFSISPGMDDPSKPMCGRSADRFSSSGHAHAFPFRNLSSFAVNN